MTLADQAAHTLEPRERIELYMRENGLDVSAHRIIPLTGDASDRRYFRLTGPDGRTLVLAVHTGQIAFSELPFANVAELFQRLPLPVPAILGHSDPLGIIALEDLGDVTLQAHLGIGTVSEHAQSYRQAVDFLEVMQRRGSKLASAAYIPYGLAFDVEKLTWELDFFVKHFVEAYRGAALTPAERVAMREEWSAIANDLAAEPRVLCHRDYHSRNLMVHSGGLYIIDFQDARMGPDTYDLVSLLRDSYVDLTEPEVDSFIAYFLALKNERFGDVEGGREDFRIRFDVMSVQRNLKALGTFGFQTTARRNPAYVQYMPRTLRYVRLNLERYPRFSRLRELLSRHIEEM